MNNTNIMLAQRRTSYSSYARTSETGLTLCPHMDDESSHKWQLVALLCMLKIDTVNHC